MTANRLGIADLTEHSDARKLALHWRVHPMTVAEFVSAPTALTDPCNEPLPFRDVCKEMRGFQGD